MIFLP